MNVTEQLFSLSDAKYRAFHSKLMPTVSPDLIIGIRTPVLRKFAKDFAKTDDAEAFLNALPHTYYEENNLHAFLIEQIKDFDTALAKTEVFLPHIDNWATCDMFLPAVFRKNTDILVPKIYEWLKSSEPFTVRYAIGLLLKLYLDVKFKSEYMQTVASVKSDHYYVNMMIAWYFATALAKQYDSAITYIENGVLDSWVHNKTIQKANESLVIPKETKNYLKTLKKVG